MSNAPYTYAQTLDDGGVQFWHHVTLFNSDTSSKFLIPDDPLDGTAFAFQLQLVSECSEQSPSTCSVLRRVVSHTFTYDSCMLAC